MYYIEPEPDILTLETTQDEEIHGEPFEANSRVHETSGMLSNSHTKIYYYRKDKKKWLVGKGTSIEEDAEIEVSISEILLEPVKLTT